MKNINNVLFVIIAAFILFIAASPNNKKNKIKRFETKVFTCNTVLIAKKYIELYAKQGFNVDYMISQNVSTSIDRFHSSSYRDIRGDILLVMKKEIE